MKKKHKRICFVFQVMFFVRTRVEEAFTKSKNVPLILCT